MWWRQPVARWCRARAALSRVNGAARSPLASSRALSAGPSRARPAPRPRRLAAVSLGALFGQNASPSSSAATAPLSKSLSEMPSADGIVCDWRLASRTPAQVEEAANRLIADVKAAYDRVAAVEIDDVTYDNVVKVLINIEREHATREGPLDFAQHSVPDKSLREASVKASQRLNELAVEVAMRKDVFDRVVAFKEKVGLDGLREEQRRFVEKEIVMGKRNGLHLPEAEREEIKKVKKRISELCTLYQSNANEDTTTLEFTKEELAGVPEDVVGTFDKTADGKLKVTMKYPHFFPVTRKCKVPETRRRMETAYQSRCLKENTPILEELVELRQKQADLLGYKNHASYVQELRMAKNPEKVSEFLEGLCDKLQPIWEKEKEEMLELKKAECEKLGLDFNGKLDFWDFRYYATMIEETKYAVDQEKLKEYFPIQKVTAGLLEIYQELLGLKFTQVEKADAWHEDVKLYQVDDASSGEKMGFFFLDLHPRDGKYGHAAIFDLQPTCLNDDGQTRQVGLCAMMCNFAKPTASKPSLLDHGEVETYFHEFGHVMHMLCSKTDTARFHGTNIERDFVEAPSQMLENWVWEEEALKKMSGHYKDDSPIPRDLLDKLTSSRRANAGGFNLRQIALATFDQLAHTRAKADAAKLFADTYEKILGVRPIEGTNMTAHWGHMVGYDAQYYGYLWSEVFSFDMFETRFRAEGLLSPAVGRDYRAKILKPGGSKDAAELLRDFLGRDPTDEAFLKAKGLKV